MPGRDAHADVVVIGSGPSGLRCAEKLAIAGCSVELVGAEPGLPYNRVALSNYLVGDVDAAGLITYSAERLAELGIALRSGIRVTSIGRSVKAVSTSSGAIISYNKLVLATGSIPFRLPLPGANLPGVLMYRTLDEVNAMLEAAQSGGRAIVIGGGLLGLEAAVGLTKRGMKTTVLHAVDRLMERQLDHQAAHLLAERLRSQGIDVELAAGSVAIAGESKATGVILKDGRTLPADLVVMAVGIRPETTLAREAGLGLGRGIIVDDQMRSTDIDIYAIGECAEHRGACCGLVAPCFDQAEIAARHILGEQVAYQPKTDATALKIAGAGAWSGGDIEAKDAENLIYTDLESAEYRRFILRDHRLIGAVLYGETSDAPYYKSLLGQDVRALRHVLAFGRAYAPKEIAA
jgi:nitrite reductase (NADH) large subunit